MRKVRERYGMYANPCWQWWTFKIHSLYAGSHRRGVKYTCLFKLSFVVFNLYFHWLIIWFKNLQSSASPISPPSLSSLLPSLHVVYSMRETEWKLLSYLIMDLVAPLQACTIGRYWIPLWDQWENRRTGKEWVGEGGRERRWRRDGADKNRNPVASPICKWGRVKPSS